MVRAKVVMAFRPSTRAASSRRRMQAKGRRRSRNYISPGRDAPKSSKSMTADRDDGSNKERLRRSVEGRAVRVLLGKKIARKTGERTLRRRNEGGEERGHDVSCPYRGG